MDLLEGLSRTVDFPLSLGRTVVVPEGSGLDHEPT